MKQICKNKFFTLLLSMFLVVTACFSTGMPLSAAENPEVTYKETSNWGNGFQGEITINNKTGKSISGWTLRFQMGSKIQSLWGAQLVSQKGDEILVTNSDWDTVLEAGGKRSIGFVAEKAGTTKPEKFSFNGESAGGNSGETKPEEKDTEQKDTEQKDTEQKDTEQKEQPGNSNQGNGSGNTSDNGGQNNNNENKGNPTEGCYYIKNVLSNKYLAVEGGNGSAGTNVCIATKSNSKGQQWKLTYTSDGYLTLTTALGNYMLDVANGSGENGANIGIYHAYSGDAQRFMLLESGKAGVYFIATKASAGKRVLDVYGQRTADGTNVCQWEKLGNPNQQWILEKASEEAAPSEGQSGSNTGAKAYTEFPTIPSDVPDEDIIQVNGTYYMVSTTMNMCPGVPIMKSKDLVHWQIVNYVYDTFENDAVTNLQNGKHMYSHGSWAASLKYDEVSKMYYVAFNSNDHGFYIYTTKDIEKGKWEKHSIRASFHDPALFFENGKMYVISAAGGSCKIQELSLSGTQVNRVGYERTLFKASGWSLWEGAHAYKINGSYYVFIIGSPNGRWMRTQICYKSDNLYGNWQEKVIYQGGLGGNGAGLAQGGVVQGPDGTWHGFAFQDMGALGRSPSVVNIKWENGWPMFVASGSGMFLGTNESGEKSFIVDSDDFDASSLKLVWQWNHNPQNAFWSLTKKPGYLHLTTDRLVDNIYFAHNSLTQRTYGNSFTSEVKLYTDDMKPGDYAGLTSMSDAYGMIGVTCNDRGERFIYQANGAFLKNFGSFNAVSSERIQKGQPVYLRIAYNFRTSTADFFYSMNGNSWKKLGNTQRLAFSTSTTFMGTRTWLFNYATKQIGGSVDFDYYKISN